MAFVTVVAGPAQCSVPGVNHRPECPGGRITGPPWGVPQPACLFRACEDAAVMLQKTAMNLVWFGLFPSRYRICNHPAEIADSVHEPD